MGIPEKVDEHTYISKEKLVLRPEFPDAVKIEITSRCNYNCSYCASKRNLRKIGDIDPDFLYRLFLRLREVRVKEVGLFLLGESLLIKNLPEYVKVAKDLGFQYVFLTTNGSLCTLDRVIPLIESGLDSIKFSINAGSRDRYFKMHGVDKFQNVLDNIFYISKYIKQRKTYDRDLSIRTCVSTIFIDEYKNELEDLKDSVSQYVDDFYFLPLYNQAGHIGGIEYTKIIGNPGRYENMVQPIPCWAIFNAFKISWDGWYTACCFDHDTSFYISDLNKVSLMDAWHDPKVVRMRREHLNNSFSKESLCARCLNIE